MMCTKARRQGSWLVIGLMIIFIFALGWWVDYVHRISAEEHQLREAQTLRAELIVISDPTPMIMCSGSECIITVCNPAAERLFGYSQSELLGHSICRLIPENLKGRHNVAFKMAVAKATERPESHYTQFRSGMRSVAIRRDETLVNVELSVRVIKYGGDFEFIASFKPWSVGDPESPLLEGGFPLPDVRRRLNTQINMSRIGHRK